MAGGGAEALTVSRGYDGRIDLLLSDIEMNDMSGIDLAHQMTAERRGLRVLLKSGKSGLCRTRGVRLFGETLFSGPIAKRGPEDG